QKTHGAGVESSDWTETSFALPLSEKRLWSVGRAALWGAGATASEEGEISLSRGLLPYDADASAFHIGADWERADGGVAGFSIGRTSGKARAEQRIGGIEIKNLTRSSLTGVHPYLLWRLNDRMQGWLALGYGVGAAEVTETQFTTTRRATADLVLTLAAFGAQWQRPADDICALDLALRADGMLTRSALDGAIFDDGSVLPGITADTMRLGLGGEAGRTWECPAGTLRAFATAAVRNDFGDARKTASAAADLGGGMRWQGDNGFTLRLQGAKQALGNGDQHTWDAEMHWTIRRQELNLAPYAQLTSGSKSPNWQSGIRLSLRRLNLQLGLGLNNTGTDYSQLLRGEIRF
ncbi:MAG: autotransporter domain-containing protein, partial [Gammaproteobacteria bacterium]|nr:autotransporter domain-containing protein [Gammaproteobacteria bacterium]